jgi:hypothetical protein
MYDMQTYRGMEVQLNSILTSVANAQLHNTEALPLEKKALITH